MLQFAVFNYIGSQTWRGRAFSISCFAAEVHSPEPSLGKCSLPLANLGTSTRFSGESGIPIVLTYTVMSHQMQSAIKPDVAVIMEWGGVDGRQIFAIPKHVPNNIKARARIGGQTFVVSQENISQTK